MTTHFPGTLIVFEGIDGTGKSTQITLLGDQLRKNGYQVVITREPTDGPFGQEIRRLYSCRNEVTQQDELELFINDRRQHVEQLILPSLRAGAIVLCDRYYLSTAAYQGANGFDPMEIIRLNSFAPEPDLALILEVSLQTSMERITGGRGEQLNDFEQSESLARVRDIFEQLNFPYIRRINAERTIADIHHEIVNEVLHFVVERLPEKMEQT